MAKLLRTLSKLLKKCLVDKEEALLTPVCVAGGGNITKVLAVAAGGFSISDWLGLTSESLSLA